MERRYARWPVRASSTRQTTEAGGSGSRRPGSFGDGIVVQESSENRIQGNTVQPNGPFSGISVVGASQRNEVLENTVADNNMLHVGDPAAGRQAMGIRLEGPSANHNKVVGNTVTASGADGIVVLPTCVTSLGQPECAGSPPNEHNEITSNISNGNAAQVAHPSTAARRVGPHRGVAPGHGAIEIDQEDDDALEAGRTWVVRLRRGRRNVIVGRDLGRFSATALTDELRQLLHPRAGQEGGPVE